jgi:hypothetical protein
METSTTTTTELTPDPGTLEIATEQEERALFADVDAIFQGDLPLGALFGLDADDIHAFADLADDLLAAGRVRDALVLYEGCVLLDPLDVTLLCGYVLALRHAGNAPGVRQMTTLIEELAPRDPEVRAFLKATRLAERV